MTCKHAFSIIRLAGLSTIAELVTAGTSKNYGIHTSAGKLPKAQT